MSITVLGDASKNTKPLPHPRRDIHQVQRTHLHFLHQTLYIPLDIPLHLYHNQKDFHQVPPKKDRMLLIDGWPPLYLYIISIKQKFSVPLPIPHRC